MRDLAAAYSLGAGLWADGPGRVYRRLADLLVEFSPVSMSGSTVLDLGSGTGFGSLAARAVGARVIATDVSLGMLLEDPDRRPPAAAGDAVALPFRNGAFDVVLAAFSLNHLTRPEAGVAEAARVGGVLVASTYAVDDDHIAKGAVETALSEIGWIRPPWYQDVKASMAAWGSINTASEVIRRGGMRPLRVERVEVEFADLGPEDMVAWRMGLAQSAAFVSALAPDARADRVQRALELLGPNPPPLVRRAIFLAAA